MKYLFKLMSVFVMGFILFGSMAQADTKILAFGDNLDFGSVVVGESVSKELTLYNRGDSPLTITEIRFHENISEVYSGSYSGVIAPGGEQNVTITFSPQDEIRYAGLVYVESDRTNTNDRSKLLSGIGIPEEISEPTRILAFGENLDFGEVPLNGTVTKELVLYNHGNSPLTITEVRFHSRLKDRFTGEFSGVIAPGGEQRVEITFTPNEIELYKGLVYVESDRTNTNDRSKLLKGNGIEAIGDIDLESGLLVHYEFEDNIENSAGSDYDGVSYTSMVYVDGMDGKAGHFDNNYITVGNLSTLSFTDELTISSLIKPTSFASESHDYLYFLSGLNDLELNRYNLITWTFKDDKLKIYLDGTLFNTLDMSMIMLKQYVLQALDILYTSPRSLGFFKGDIDDFRFYNRALTDEEIQALYNMKFI